MALNLTFSEEVALAALVFAILAVLLFLPYFLIAFGFFSESGFASRVHPSNDKVLTELRAQNEQLGAINRNAEIINENVERLNSNVETLNNNVERLNNDVGKLSNDVKKIKKTSDFALEWLEHHTDIVTTIFEDEKEKMD
jgi:outer membrane murein-binding lipoprotein Lpp